MATNHNFRIKNGLEVGGTVIVSSDGVMTIPTNSTGSTQDGGTNNTRLATTAFVQQEITTLIGGAPGSLDTLNELAAAINDDASYASTLTTALATKLPLAGGTLTGGLAGTTASFSGAITAPSIQASSGTFNIKRSNDGTNALQVLTTGEVVIGSNYLYVTASAGAYFSNAVRFRGTISNDTGTNVTFGQPISVSGAITSSGDIGMVTGHSSGKFAVMASSVHGSYDFYNNGTSYFNGTVAVDANLTLSGGGQILGSPNITAGRVITTGLYGTGHGSSMLPIWQYNSGNPGYGFGYVEGSPDSFRFDVSNNLLSGTPDFEISTDVARVNGNTVWHAGNDSSGSGLDADLLDGQQLSYVMNYDNLSNKPTNIGNSDTVDGLHAASFLRSDTADTGSGKITLTATEGLEVGGIRGRAIGSQSGDFIQMYERVSIGYPSGWGATGANNAPTQGLTTHGGAMFNTGNVSGAPLTFNGNTIWRADNDGSGSGLDADLLDGQQPSQSGGANKIAQFASNGYLTVGNWIYSANATGIYWPSGLHVYENSGNLHINTAGSKYTSAAQGTLWGSSNDGSGSGLDADLLDGQHGSYYAPIGNLGNYLPLAGGTMTGDLHLANNVGLTSTTTGEALRVLFPGGGARKNSAGSETGAIKVTLPVGMTNSMLSFKVTVYQYNTDDSFEVHVGGYNYPTGLTWVHNPFGYITGSPKAGHGPYAIRFGYDSNSKACVYIGETTTVWSYPQIAVTEAMVGYSGYGNSSWDNGWDVSIATSFENVTHTIAATDTSTVGWHPYNDGSGSGLDADLLDGQHGSYYAPASTVGNGTLTVATAGSASGGGTFTANQSGNTTITVTGGTIPTNNNQLTNGAGYLTNSNDRIYITDTRSANRAPSYYDDRYVQADFSQSTHFGVSGGDSWGTALTVSKWASYDASHRQEQLIFAGTKLARRVATSDSAWSSTYTIWDSSTDGSGSGLDADLLDGYNSSTSATANTVVVRDSNAHISGNYILGSYFNASSGNSENPTIGQIWTQSTGDNYLRKSTPAHFVSQLNLVQTDGTNAAFVKVPANYTGNLNSISNAGVYFTEATGSVSNNPFSSSGSFLQLGDAGGTDVRLQFYAKSSLDRIAFRNQWGTNNWGSWHEFWTTQNDGSGSGLDADLLDGQHGSYYLPTTGKAADSDLLDGIDSARVVYASGTNAMGASRVGFASLTNSRAGFYDVYNSGTPTGTWYSLVNMPHSSANHGHQIAGSFYSSGDIYNRNNNNTTLSAWAKIWNTANDGAGSGLDADLLDGNHASAFLIASPTSITIDGAQDQVISTTTHSLEIKNMGATGAGGLVLQGSSGTHGLQMYWDSDGAYYGFLDAAWANWDIRKARNGAFSVDEGAGLKRVLNEANWSSYITLPTDADTIDGRGFVNTGSNSAQNADTINSNGISYYTSGVSNFSGNATDGALYSQQYSSSWQHQIAGDYRSGQIALRGRNNGTWQSWRKVWDVSNDGAGSGLDADLLDGQHGSYYTNPTSLPANGGNADTVDNLHAASFLRSDAADSFNSTITMATQKALVANDYGHGVYGVYSATKHQHVWSMGTSYNLASNGASVGNLYGLSYTHTNIGTGYGGNSAAGLGHQLNGRANGTLQWALGDGMWSSVTGSVWGASNDGSGSGLDADLLDGQHGSYYLPTTGKAADSNLLDGLDLHTGRNNEVNKVVRTNSSGYADFGWINTTSGATSSTLNRIYCSEDGYIRYQTPANFGTSISPHINFTTIANNKILPTSGNYVWSASTAASGYSPVGISTSFVRSTDGWPGYGGVLHVGARGGSDAGGDFQIYCGHGSANGGNYLRFRNADNSASPSDAWTGWKTIWGSGNDGSGSGLDADLLDGQQGSYYLPTTGKAADSNLLDGLDLHTGRNNEVNKVVRTDGNGYIQAGWINTTSGDMAVTTDLARVYCSDDGYLRYMSNSNFKVKMGLSGQTNYDRRDYTSGVQYYTGANSHNDTTYNGLLQRGCGFIDNWNNGAGSPPTTGGTHWNGFQAMHYASGSSYFHGMQMAMAAGNPSYTYLRGWWANGGSGYGWQKIWTDGNDGSGSGLDADTLDGSHASSFITTSTTNASALYIRNTSPTVYLRDTDHNASMLHCNSNIFYILRGATDSTTWTQVGGKWPMELSLTSNSVTFGGNVTAYSDVSLKENIKPIGNSMEMFEQIDAKRFDWIVDGKKDIGFIAQDVQAAGLNEVVIEKENRDPETGELLDTKLTLDYSRMVSVLWDVVKEQQAQIDELKKLIGV